MNEDKMEYIKLMYRTEHMTHLGIFVFVQFFIIFSIIIDEETIGPNCSATLGIVLKRTYFLT